MPGAGGRGDTVNRSAAARLAVTCAAVALAAVPLAAAAPGAAAAGQVSVAITSISPDIARPGQPVTVSGTVSNTTASAVSGMSVQLRSSGSGLTSRGDLTNYAAGNLPVDSYVAGAVTQLPGRLEPGGTESWTVTLPVREVGMTAFGVYPLAAEVDANGVALDTDRSFLPFWPGKSAAALAGPLQIAWVWPLIDSPHQAACRALLDNSLAASLSTGGRLGGLLAAGSTSTAASARPDLGHRPGPAGQRVGDDQALRRGGQRDLYRQDRETGLHGGAELARDAPLGDRPAGFLRHAVRRRGRGSARPPGHGSGPDQRVQRRPVGGRLILGSAQRPATASTELGQGHATPADGIGGIAWPAGGIADYGVLGSLAVNGIGTVILNSTMMPPATPVNYTPSAVTRTPDGVGADLHVALADDTLTQIVGSAPTGRRPVGSQPGRGSGHLIRHGAAFPRRDGHDRRRGASAAALRCGYPAAAVGSGAGSGQRPAFPRRPGHRGSARSACHPW